MPALFLDTGFFVAAVVRQDPHHETASEILDRIGRRSWTRVATSDAVLAEGLNYLQRKVRRVEAIERMLDLAFGGGEMPPIVDEVHRIHAARFASAADRLQRQFGRGLSFTDWTTVALMEELGIGELATFDGGFRGIVPVVPR